MITSLFYYNHYRPYIIKENGNKRVRISSSDERFKTLSNAEEPLNEEVSYFLNKALKQNIKSYVNNLSSGFNYLKSHTNYLYLKLNKNFDIQENVENSANKIAQFAEKYNKFLNFYETNENRQEEISYYFDYLKNLIGDNKEIFNQAGISIDENKKLMLERNFNNKFLSCDKDTLNELKDICYDIYKKTCEVMERPLTNYMHFKDFSYYFNYGLYKDNQKTFTLVERGLLVDVGI